MNYILNNKIKVTKPCLLLICLYQLLPYPFICLAVYESNVTVVVLMTKIYNILHLKASLERIYNSLSMFSFFREDGSYTKMILLPTSQPFYLLRFSSPCQLVKGMYVREENVHFDDEDRNNKNSASGKHPMGTGNVRNQNLMYCYYSPL